MEEAQKLETFIEWATNIGISDSPVITIDPNSRQSLSCLGQSLSISCFPNAGGRGLCAVRDLHNGQLILKVPKSALMTSETLILNDHKLSMSISKLDLSSTQILTVALLNEVSKGKRSWWYPYLTQFPCSYDILASFDQFEIQALQLDDAIWAAERALEKTKAEWESATVIMEELMFKPHYMSFKAWIWASASISSRTMHIPWDSAGCFCPVGDFFNYTAPDDEQVFSKDLPDADVAAASPRLTDGMFEEEFDAYCFYARRSYKKGEQVLLSYGTYTNLELLEHYGFILNNNPNDKAYIPLPSDIYSLCSWPIDSLYIQQNGKPSFALLAVMRLWAAPTHLQKSVRHVAYSGSIISNENEIIVMRWLINECNLVLKSLNTSVEVDKLLLSVMDKDFGSVMEVKNELLGLTGESRMFLNVNGLLKVEVGDDVALHRKIIRFMISITAVGHGGVEVSRAKIKQLCLHPGTIYMIIAWHGMAKGRELQDCKPREFGCVCGGLFLGTTEKIPESELIDTTGAGDAFIGAILYAICTNRPLEQMLPFAAQVAAISCRALGARTSLPHLSEPRNNALRLEALYIRMHDVAGRVRKLGPGFWIWLFFLVYFIGFFWTDVELLVPFN